jgi:hypothetical protein
MVRTLGQPVMVPPGNTARKASNTHHAVTQAAAHGRFDVMDVAVAGDFHQRRHLHAARFAYPPEVVALEVDQHDVFGALLRMRLEARAQRGVLRRVFAARMGAGNRPGFQHTVAPEANQPLRRRTHDRPVIHLQQRGKRRRVFCIRRSSSAAGTGAANSLRQPRDRLTWNTSPARM